MASRIPATPDWRSTPVILLLAFALIFGSSALSHAADFKREVIYQVVTDRFLTAMR